jgi:hypothetical protein
MNLQDICTVIKEIGVPAAVLFWILIIGGQNQHEMTRQMSKIQEAITNLTMVIHDLVTYSKAKEGE